MDGNENQFCFTVFRKSSKTNEQFSLIASCKAILDCVCLCFIHLSIKAFSSAMISCNFNTSSGSFGGSVNG